MAEMRELKQGRLKSTINRAAWLASVLFLAVAGFGQGLNGRWTQPGKTLDNGEQQKWILELKQNGNELTGRLKNLDYAVQLKGTVAGNHFELFAPWQPKTPYLTGDLVNGELHGHGTRAASDAGYPGHRGGRYFDGELYCASAARPGDRQRAGQDAADGLEQLEPLCRQDR
jgi:hypothetical protein